MFSLRDAWRRAMDTNVVPMEDYIDANMIAAEALTGLRLAEDKLAKCQRALRTQQAVCQSYETDRQQYMEAWVAEERRVPLASMDGNAVPETTMGVVA